MTSSEKATQTRVGFFVLLGLAAICSMVVYFGRFGEGLKDYYNLRVNYPNASGLFRGADVLLAGAKVGKVDSGPYVLDSMRGVYVILKIYEGTEIPENSAFTIGSSGLLGDSYVDITMPPDLDLETAKPIQPGATVEGRKDNGFGGLADQGGKLVEELRGAVANINTVVTRINSEVLTKESVTSINVTLANLQQTSHDFAAASKKIETVLDDVSKTAREAETTVKNASDAIEKGSATLESAKKGADEFQKTMVEVRALVRDARSGKGTLGLLINDPQMAAQLRALVGNLRRHGILWYKDSATRQEQQQQAPGRR